jgi:hypothetical protein
MTAIACAFRGSPAPLSGNDELQAPFWETSGPDPSTSQAQISPSTGRCIHFVEIDQKIEMALREHEEGGSLISPRTRHAARRARGLMQALSVVLAKPDAWVDSEGDLVLEWSAGPRRVLDVAVGPAGEIHIAALFGARKLHGTEYLANGVPEFLRHCLEEFVRGSDGARR